MLRYLLLLNRLSGTMVNMKASSAVARGLDSRSGEINDLQIGMCCFSAKQIILQVRNND